MVKCTIDFLLSQEDSNLSMDRVIHTLKCGRDITWVNYSNLPCSYFLVYGSVAEASSSIVSFGIDNPSLHEISLTSNYILSDLFPSFGHLSESAKWWFMGEILDMFLSPLERDHSWISDQIELTWAYSANQIGFSELIRKSMDVFLNRLDSPLKDYFRLLVFHSNDGDSDECFRDLLSKLKILLKKHNTDIQMYQSILVERISYLQTIWEVCGERTPGLLLEGTFPLEYGEIVPVCLMDSQ